MRSLILIIIGIILLSCMAKGQSAPVITSSPTSVTIRTGQTVVFSAAATGASLRFTWYRNNVLVYTSPSTTSSTASFTLSNVQAADQGTYFVRVTDSTGRIANSTSWQVTVVPFSVQLSFSPATVTVGTAVNFTTAVTPTGTYRYQWVKDGKTLPAATLSSLNIGYATPSDSGTYVCSVTSTTNVTLSSNSASLLVSSGSGDLRIINCSTRLFVGTGDQVLITGFVLQGSGSRSLLVRAIGPGLNSFGVTGALLDPQLAVYSGSTMVAANDDWPTSLATIMAGAGAFPLAAGSRDSALVVSLSQGAYTFIVSGVNNSSGTALLEVYELP